jgi:predicted DNA-binding transcriptional regulator AlpA
MNGLLTLREVEDLTRLSRSTIERLERAGKFPVRRRVSTRAVRWPAAEVERWLCGEVVVDDADDRHG